MFNENILIIMQDREKGIRLQKLFLNSGFKVVGVITDPYKGIRILRTTEVHLTVIDSGIPGISYKRFAEILEYEDLGPLLVIGAESLQIFQELPSSVYGVLTPPVTRGQLLSTASMAIRQYKINLKLKNELNLLRRKLTDKKMIDQAKYIIMQRENINEEQAYEKIRQVSMDKRLPLKKVAEFIISHQEINNTNQDLV